VLERRLGRLRRVLLLEQQPAEQELRLPERLSSSGSARTPASAPSTSPLRNCSASIATRGAGQVVSRPAASVYAAFAWSSWPRLSNTRPSTNFTSGLRGSRKLACCAAATASLALVERILRERAERERHMRLGRSARRGRRRGLRRLDRAAALPCAASAKASPVPAGADRGASSSAFW
jgi:hypothetical protein